MFADIRSACAEVAKRSRYVTLIEDKLAAYAQSLPVETPEPVYDSVHHFVGSPEDTLAYIITLDTVNFGSGYFPHLQKRPGMSGYFTVASALKDHFGTHGPLNAPALNKLTLRDCSSLFQQDLTNPVRAELMQHFTRALNDLGTYLTERFDGFAGLIEKSEHSAERLATYLTEMPYFQDVATYENLRVPLYKRAQITASDLALAFDGGGYGSFNDLDKLTIFADNLVPHVLRLDGVLHFGEELLSRIRAGQRIAPGSPEEVEIRAVALHAVERMVSTLRKNGLEHVTAQNLDVRLWNRGQAARYKAEPRHRTRTVYY